MTGEAQTLKDQGNDMFRKGDYLKAAALYTKAIKEQPTAVLYSNRSAALLKLNKVAKACQDAEECIKLDPSWDKGYFRLALGLESSGRVEEALTWYQKAQQAAQSNPEYAAKVKALSKSINRSKQLASKLDNSRTKKSPEEIAALEFAESKLAYAVDLIKQHGSSFPPELHFSSSSSSKSADTAQSAVRAEHAFDSPEVLMQFVAEMRLKAEELSATTAVLIAPKSAISFPQTWRQVQNWPFGAHDGVFVQLQALLKQPNGSNGSKADQQKAKAASDSSSTLRKTWFIKLRENKPPLEPQEVSQEYELLPQLLK